MRERRAPLMLSRVGFAALVSLTSACSPTSLEPFASTERGFFSNGSDQLAYAFDFPNGVERPPVVVFAHSSGRDTADRLARFARPLVQRGIAAFRFASRLPRRGRAQAGSGAVRAAR